jgi:hypothetical protein
MSAFKGRASAHGNIYSNEIVIQTYTRFYKEELQNDNA